MPLSTAVDQALIRSGRCAGGGAQVSASLIPHSCRIGILDLPTEILVEILDSPTFPSETLYALALLCRRLHFLVLPMYFSRHGTISTPNSIVISMRTDRRDLLSALQTALFIPQIDTLTCIFPHPCCTGIFKLLPLCAACRGSSSA
jgi:hypothetical protein